MNIKELQNSLNRLNSQIEKVLRESGFDMCGELEIEYNREDPEEVMLWSEFSTMLTKLDDVSRNLKYLNRPIRRSGKLRKNSNGRYECDGYELTSGSSVEILVYDRYGERYEWLATSIEHNGRDYYAVGDRDLDLDGVEARVR